jgi:hypothetical protein
MTIAKKSTPSRPPAKKAVSKNAAPVAKASSDASWLTSQLTRAHQGKNRTVALFVHESQIRSGELDSVILPAGLSASEEFRKDLNMGNAYWFYHNYGSAGMQRTLLIQK